MVNTKKKTTETTKRNVRMTDKKPSAPKGVKKTPAKKAPPKKKQEAPKRTVKKGNNTKKTPVKKEKKDNKKSKGPSKKTTKKNPESNSNKGLLKCVIKTRVNFIKMGNSLTAATIRPHLTNLAKQHHSTRNTQIHDTIRNLKAFRSFNPGEKNRWKDILQVEGSTSLIGVKTAPSTLKMVLYTALYTIYEDIYAFRGQNPDLKSKVVQAEDVEAYFNELKPIKYGSSFVIPWDDINSSTKKKSSNAEGEEENEPKEQKSSKKKVSKSDTVESEDGELSKKKKSEKPDNEDQNDSVGKKRKAESSKKESGNAKKNDVGESESEVEKKPKKARR